MEGLAVVGADVCDHGVLVSAAVTTTDVVGGNLARAAKYNFYFGANRLEEWVGKTIE